MSSASDIVRHPAYEEIIALGSEHRVPVIRLIFAELEQRPALWFDSLQALTGENPVKPENVGRLRGMISDWMELGQRHGYL